ncbi:galactonate dehydratase [Pricia antarctica]|uniref:Galactonate dehydratase n=1 Tax=Pricia antarctica TaxID=641691 RepID=A0A1G7CT94_9FLAO|nr:galactonate dehydratase [Pricia antarctica]
MGKALGVPVCELLGGKQRDFVECFASVRFRTKEELLEYSKICIKEGWKMLRLAPAEFETKDDKELFDPRKSIAIIVDWVTDLRKEVGSKITIVIPSTYIILTYKSNNRLGFG